MADKRTKALAKTMRRRMTRYEYRLYAHFLSTLPVRVCRQKVIDNYIVDFLLPESMLIIEVDGSQHYTESGLAADAIRDEHLRSLGYTVIRYSNEDIRINLDGVAESILQKLGLEEQ